MWVRAGPIVLLFLLILISPVYADVASWDYFITEADQSMIDMSQTTAKIDNTNHEITLKQILPRSVGLYENVMDYVVLSPDGFKHYSFDGTGMREVEFLGKDKVINPLAVCTSPLYPDAVLYDKDSNQVTHYSFMGGMVANPILSVSGMDNVISIGTRNLDLAFIQDKEVKYYGFTGIGLSSVPSLSKTLTNPIDFALFPNNYNMAVIDGNQIKYFKNGSEIPGSAITGLSNPISISANELGIAVIDGNQVKHYTLSGDTFTYSSALSITSNLTNPRCVAIKPGTQDRIVVDGDQVKYYSYDGSKLIYNSALSTTVSGLNNLFVYIPNAVVISKIPEGLTRDVSQARVRAYCEVPNNTSITWFLTIDGENWVTCWRVRGTPAGSLLEMTKDNGLTWTNIGNVSVGYPTNNDIRLMFTFDPANKNLKWKAQLQGTSKNTPKIRTISGNPAVKLDVNTKPSKPTPDPDNKIPNPSNECLITATPILDWEFIDPDIGDQQTAFEIEVYTYNDIKIIPINPSLPEIIETHETKYTIPSDVLFQSGEYEFKYHVKTRDKGGLWSEFSDWKPFCVVAFESPRIREIVHPSAGQIAPNPEEPSTYIHILKGMLKGELPKTKAGGKVGLFLNGIGLDLPNINLKIPYKDKYAVFTEGHPVVKKNIGTNNKFLLEFYTSSNPKICPDGTVIKGDFRGYNYNTIPRMILSPKNDLDSYDIEYYYADGIATTEGTVLSDWMIVLQGRKNS
jgi:hypothetical protein